MKNAHKLELLLCGLSLVLLWTIMSIVATAQITRKINYQGYLKDASGNPVYKNITMHFAIYDHYSSIKPVNRLWTETQKVSVNNGVFNVRLGEKTPIELNDAKTYYLGLTVKPDATEMKPRQELTSVLSAFFAKQVEGMTVKDGKIGIGTTNPEADLHIESGDLMIQSDQEQEIRMVFTNFSTLAKPVFPIYTSMQEVQVKMGRIVAAGDGSPEFRFLFQGFRSNGTSLQPEHSVFEFDDKGIVASVKPLFGNRATSLGSHFEGFIKDEAVPLFRINSAPAMQFEMGTGGNNPATDETDLKLRRSPEGDFVVVTGAGTALDPENERLRVRAQGDIGVMSGDLYFWNAADKFQGAPSYGLGFNNQTSTPVPILQLGGYYGLQFAESGDVRMAIRQGKVGIGTRTPQSELQVSGYIQLGTVNNTPPAEDCNAAEEIGRMKIHANGTTLFICRGQNGWGQVSIQPLP